MYLCSCTHCIIYLPEVQSALENHSFFVPLPLIHTGVQKLASSSRSSPKDLELFTVHLQQLIKHCNYDIDNIQDENDGPPLLVR